MPCHHPPGGGGRGTGQKFHSHLESANLLIISHSCTMHISSPDHQPFLHISSHPHQLSWISAFQLISSLACELPSSSAILAHQLSCSSAILAHQLISNSCTSALMLIGSTTHQLSCSSAVIAHQFSHSSTLLHISFMGQ